MGLLKGDARSLDCSLYKVVQDFFHPEYVGNPQSFVRCALLGAPRWMIVWSSAEHLSLVYVDA